MGKKIIITLLIAGVIAVSIWGPEKLAEYRDRSTFNQIHIEPGPLTEEGYRYTLNSNEKLYILSEALSSQKLSESRNHANSQNSLAEGNYQAGSYALVMNHRQSDDKEITSEDVYRICNRELDRLTELGIFPEGMAAVESGTYDAVLYSAIDVLEPRNNVAVWKISLSNIRRSVSKQNRLIDAYIDADNGTIYEFYVRTEYEWEDIDPDETIAVWREYMGLGTAFAHETANPLLETTPYFKKYLFTGKGEGQTIVTVGFYEGINELFLRISR